MNDYYKTKVWQGSLHVVISGFLFCYTFGVFNTCAANVAASLNWGSDEALYTTLFSAFVPSGALLGATAAGPLMNRLGRRAVTMRSDLLMILSSGITCIPFTFTFAAGRFLSGIAAGLFMTIPPNYVNEMTPPDMLAKTGPLVQISANVGLVFAYGFGLVLPTSDFLNSSLNYWWVFMFAFPGIVAFYQFWFFWKVWVFDTPAWLLQHGKNEEALKSLQIVYKEGLENDENLISLIKTEDFKGEKQEIRFRELFFHKKYRKMMRIGIVLAILQQVSGINAGIFYSTSIYLKIGGSVFMARLFTFVTALVFLAAGLFSIVLVSSFGRVTLLISGQLLLAVDLAGLAVSILLGKAPDLLLVAGVMLIFVFFVYSLGSTLWLYLGEICVDKALGVSASVNLVFVLLVTLFFPIVVDEFGIEVPFFFFSACMFGGVFYCFFELVETKDRTKADIMKDILA